MARAQSMPSSRGGAAGGGAGLATAGRGDGWDRDSPGRSTAQSMKSGCTGRRAAGGLRSRLGIGGAISPAASQKSPGATPSGAEAGPPGAGASSPSTRTPIT